MSAFSRFGKALAIAALLIAAPPVASQTDATLARAQELVDSGQAAAAFALLEPQVGERAGDPAFDYVFALAALDSDHVSEGVFALERVLSVEPDHPQARAELARAYMMLGELDNARAEFEAVKATNPPPEVVATIDRYLAEIDRRQGGPPATRIRGFVALTGGWDSNVNSAQDASTINVPLFASLSPTGNGTTQISAAGIGRTDLFGQLSGGISVFHRLGPRLALLADANVAQRLNESERAFDTGNGAGDLGITWQRDHDVFTAALQGSRFLLDRAMYRDAFGISGQWRRNLTPGSWAAGYLQATRLTYESQPIRDADRYTLGGVYTTELGGAYRPTVTLGLYGGREAERASGVPQLGHRFQGISASAKFEIRRDLTGYLSAGAERRDYGGTDPFFLVSRNDTFYRFGGSVAYEFAPRWNLIPQIQYNRNVSNVTLNEYDRVILSLTVRRNFE